MPQIRRNSHLAGRALFTLLLSVLLSPTWALPRVASINLCSDQLLLELADPAQIVSVSWLAADPEESLLAARTGGVPLNYGSAEELLRFTPDVVLAGTLTGDHTRTLLERMGYRVVALPPANSVAEIRAGIRTVADAIAQRQRGEQLIAAMDQRIAALERAGPAYAADAVVVRPGGFTVGAQELGNEMMRLAGVRNVAAAGGLDRWGSLSMETLARSTPDLLILNGYRAGEPSIANAVLEHPVLKRIGGRVSTVSVPNRYWVCGLPQSLESVDLIRTALPS